MKMRTTKRGVRPAQVKLSSYSYINEKGKKVSGNGALLHLFKENGGVDKTVNSIVTVATYNAISQLFNSSND